MMIPLESHENPIFGDNISNYHGYIYIALLVKNYTNYEWVFDDISNEISWFLHGFSKKFPFSAPLLLGLLGSSGSCSSLAAIPPSFTKKYGIHGLKNTMVSGSFYRKPSYFMGKKHVCYMCSLFPAGCPCFFLHQSIDNHQ